MSNITTFDELNTELFNDLTAELSVVDAQYSTSIEPVIMAKVKNATRKVLAARNYPDSNLYTEEYIVNEIANKYYNVCRDLALFYYNTIGAEFQQSHDENEIKRVWRNENNILNGITPISRVV